MATQLSRSAELHTASLRSSEGVSMVRTRSTPFNLCEQLPPTTSVLLIDGSKKQRTYWAEQLKTCSPDYQILEASDGQSGLDLYRSRRIDCVVLELALPDQSGFELLTRIVRVASMPQVPVVVLTLLTYQGIWDLAKENGAFTCLAKKCTTGNDLHKSIQRALAFVAPMPMERSVPASLAGGLARSPEARGSSFSR